MLQGKKASLSVSSETQSMMKTFDEGAMMFLDLCQSLCVMGAIGFGQICKLTVRHFPFSLVFFYSLYELTNYFVLRHSHLTKLFSAEPKVFTLDIIKWTLKFPLYTHHLVILGLLLISVSIVLGIKLCFVRSKFVKIFSIAGLTNGIGDTPKLVYIKKLDKYRVQYDFDANGVGISEFETKKERIESQFRMEIESIKTGKNPGRILIIFNRSKFPEKVEYSEFTDRKILSPHSFYVGLSPEGVVSQDIAELPHMMIAGATNTGKSVFFKSVLYSLLNSTNYRNLQVYIIDLKRGLEAIDFKAAPNVKIIKNIKEAVTLLSQVQAEMDRRFDILENKNDGQKTIIPEKDGLPRIIVAVDEASVLYMNRSRDDVDYKDVMQARQLADNISKLSRAAAIHLILATQKVEKNVLPTTVTENITGRMAFRANSFHGSNALLQSKDASDLPDIPGRGVWRVGSKKVVVQTPFIDEKQIKELCLRIKEKVEESQPNKKLSLLGDDVQKKGDKARNNFDSEVKDGNDEEKPKETN